MPLYSTLCPPAFQCAAWHSLPQDTPALHCEHGFGRRSGARRGGSGCSRGGGAELVLNCLDVRHCWLVSLLHRHTNPPYRLAFFPATRLRQCHSRCRGCTALEQALDRPPYGTTSASKWSLSRLDNRGSWHRSWTTRGEVFSQPPCDTTVLPRRNLSSRHTLVRT